MTKHKDVELVRREYDFGLLERAPSDWDAPGPREVDIVASTDSVDSYGEIVAQDWDLKRFKKNPIILYAHSTWQLPLGTAVKTKVEEGRLIARVRFASAEANPQAEQIWKLVQEKVLRAVSVGFRCKKARYHAESDTYVLSGCELYEISFCAIGANPDAVTLSARTKTLELIRSLASDPETKNMDALLKLLGASSEAQAVEAVTELQRVRDAATRATDCKTPAEIEGKLLAWKAASEQLAAAEAKLAEQAKAAEVAARKTLIEQGRKDGKLTPKSAEWAEGVELDVLKSFLAAAPTIPALTSKSDPEPLAQPGSLVWHGKSWGELTPIQKHTLHDESPELYAAMRDAAKA